MQAQAQVRQLLYNFRKPHCRSNLRRLLEKVTDRPDVEMEFGLQPAPYNDPALT